MSFERRLSALAAPLVATVAALASSAATVQAQVTTASLAGRITNAAGAPVTTASVTAIHQPSGTTYRASVRADGRYTIPGMRVGGPYQVTARALGYAPISRGGINLGLGGQTEIDLTLQQAAVQLSTVAVTAEAEGSAISSSRTGAATRVTTEAIQTLPTISRTINDFTRLTPQASGGSFAGIDNRLNNIMVDGAFFNNAFGLGSQPGGRTGTAPIPLDAIDQIQVSIAPYDVRQGMFVGAGVNAVTRSGTNNLEGSLYYVTRDEGFVGTRAGTAEVNPGTFSFAQIGARIGGPIIKNKLFFFANFEDDQLDEPGTTFLPNNGSQTAGQNVTRVLESDLQRVSSLLAERFGYQTGPYTGYNNETPSRRYLAKLDFNASDRNKFSLRYSKLESSSDNLVSNSSSLGFGNRRTNINAMSFANSGYKQFENIDSWVGEWNAQLAGGMSNQLIVGYTKNDESRGATGGIFPTVDILQGGVNYINFGTDPFTPNNELRYNTFQLQNNFQLFLNKHELTFGALFERYESENVFFPGSQSVYTYNSLDDFIADVNGTRPVTLRRFQVRYNNIPGQEKPVQPLEVLSYGAYAQDQWRPNERVTLTAGLRFDLPTFGQTGFENPQANALTFRDQNGNPIQYQTQKLPDARVLFSPRLGFNWDVRGDRSTQLRGGTGIFTGRPLYVWISNQIGQNGILTGFEELNNTTQRPFSPNPDTYKPTNVTGEPARSYELNFTAPDFRFPQQWRSNIAVDQRLPFNVIATGEFIYGRDVNGIYYINANLPAAQSSFTGPDARLRWTSNRINSNIPAAYVLQNQNVGYNYTISGSLEKAFSNGLFAKAAYNYGESRNTIDPGNIAGGSFTNNPTANDPNNPGLGYSSYSPGHRAFLALSYRREYFNFGATTLSLFAERATIGNASYRFSGDLNGDGGFNNDLIYVPRDASEMNFEQFTVGSGTNSRTFTVAEQQAAWEAYIQQDDYLSSRRGQYAERNAVFLPQVLRADFSVAQDVFRPIFGKRNSFQVRLDIFNVGNLLNEDWGVSQSLVTAQPLIARGADAQGRARYRLRNFGSGANATLLEPRTFQKTASLGDVYRMQLGLRYTFQ